MTAPLRIPNRMEGKQQMTSYKDILQKRQRLDPQGRAIWPLQTQDWPSRQEARNVSPK